MRVLGTWRVLGTLGTLLWTVGCADEAGAPADVDPHDSAGTPTDPNEPDGDTGEDTAPLEPDADPEPLGVCTPTEPFALEDGLPQGAYTGVGQLEGSPSTISLSGSISGDVLVMEGLTDGFSWVTYDGFDADPVVWSSATVPVGTCTLGDGVLDCTLDPGQPLQGGRRLTFSADCLWVDQVYAQGDIIESSHFELARSR